MELKLVRLVSHSEVALGDPVPARLKRHLVAGQPSLEAHDHGSVHRGAVDVVVHVAAQVDVLVLEAALDLPALLAMEKTHSAEFDSCGKTATHDMRTSSTNKELLHYFASFNTLEAAFQSEA